MGVKLLIENSSEALTVHVRSGPRVVWIGLCIGLIVVLLGVAILAHNGAFRALAILLAGVAGAMLLRRAARGTAVELRVTAQAFVSRGRAAAAGYTPTILKWADVAGLEYRPGTPEEPEGLYAVTQQMTFLREDACLLPLLDQARTAEVIVAISSRFPPG